MRLADRISKAFEMASARGVVLTQSGLARACGISRASVHAWIHGDTGSIDGKNLTTAAAYLGVNPHWLGTGSGDMLNQVGYVSSIGPVTNFGTPSAIQADPPLVIPQYAAGGGMGRGFNLTDNPPGHIKSWQVDHEWLRLNVPSHTGLRNLAIVTGFGPSMRPMFNPGDPLLVDTGVKVIDHEGVYFFRVGEEGFIKLIQRVPEFDGPGVILRVISKNPDFPPYDISPKNPHFEVLGKVLTIWRSEHF